MNPGLLDQVTSGLQAIAQVAGGVSANRQADRNAKITRRVGEINAREIRRDTRRLVGSQIAAASASGVDPGSGTALDLQNEAIRQGARDELRALFMADSTAAAQEAQGRALLTGSIGRGVGTLLGGTQRALGLARSEQRARELIEPNRTPRDQRSGADVFNVRGLMLPGQGPLLPGNR